MRLRLSYLLYAGLFATAIAGAAPFVPASDDQVLERLPRKGADPQERALRTLRDQLAKQPTSLPLSLKLVRRYVDIGRASGDPRYAGYAEAVLAPWFALASPPLEVLVMRATLSQRMHKFDAALADLDRVLQQNPYQAQARLTKATILQVQGNFVAAGEQCGELQTLTQELIWAHCLATVQAATGTLRDSYAALNAVLERSPNVTADLRAWVATTLAEMAIRLGDIAAADTHFRSALALDSSDQYLLGAYSDFLLDNRRPKEVIALLQDKMRIDPLLLRYALALQATGSPETQRQIDALASRFDAAMLRRDRVHLREEARFVLQLRGNAKLAVKLARENWAIQKEPADARILLEAALAANDTSAAFDLRTWLARNKFEDATLAKLNSRLASHPS
jgi:Tfp pilus assembly protein PilF